MALPGIPRLGSTGGLGGIPRLGQSGGLGGLPRVGLRRPPVAINPATRRPYTELELKFAGLARGGAPGTEIRREIIERTRRPKPFLGLVAEVLNAPSNAVIGFLDGYIAERNKVLEEEEHFGNITEPWEVLKAIGAGFSEVPHSVAHNKGQETIQTGLENKFGPDSFVGRNAGVIALTTAIVADPTMYLTFGATAPSRIAAMRALADAHRASMIEARHIMTRPGKGRATYQGRRFTTMEDAFTYFHALNGRPYSMGDALDKLRVIDLKGKKGLNKLFAPRFGRGVRFAGRPIPGTKDLNQFLAVRLRGAGEDLTKYQAYRRLLHETPNHVLHHVGNDMLRASLRSEFTDFRRQQEGLQESAVASAKDLLAPMERMVNEDGPLVVVGNRTGIHRMRTADITDPALKTLKRRTESLVARTMNAARHSDVSPREIERIWDEMASRFDDPIDAAAHFAIKANTRLATRGFIKRILEDGRFAVEVPTPFGQAAHLARAGWVPHTFGKRKFLVPPSVEETLQSMTNTALQDFQLAWWLRAMNWPQNKWKVFATVMNPAFFTMNFVGALFNNMLAAVTNPIDYVRAVGMITRDRLGSTPAPMIEARARGIGGSQSFVSVEAEAGGQGGLAAQLEQEMFGPSVSRAVKERRPGLLATRPVKRPAGVSRKRFAARRARQGAGIAALATGNPLGLVAFGPEIANIGRSVNGAIEDFVRLAPFLKASRDPAVRQFLEAYGPVVVPGFKGGRGLTKAQTKVQYDIGADLSNHFQFDYRMLTENERRFAKTIFPFYTFFTRNFRLQLEQLAQQPRYVQAANQLTTYTNEEMDASLPEAFRRVLPEYFDNLEAFRIPVPDWAREKLGLPQDEPVYLNPKLPFISLNLMPPFWQIFEETGEPFPQKLMRIASPITGMWGPLSPAPFGVPGTKIAFEYLANNQLGLARPIDYQRASSNDWRDSSRDAPSWVKYLPGPLQDFFGAVKTPSGRLMMTNSRVYVLDQLSTPFINNLGQSISPEGATEYQRGQARADMVSWMTGIRLMPVDLLKLHRSWGYRLIDMLESKKAELAEVGRKPDPDDEQSLRMLRAEIRQLERLWDEREKEMYGTP